MSLKSALDDARLSTLARDARGLMPLERARALIAATTAVTRDNLDEVWCAMVSLADGEELARATRHLDWQHPPRGKFNTALVERYGAEALPWLASRREGGILVNHPWCVLPSVLALDAPGALELLLTVEGVAADGGSMSQWKYERDGAHPQHGTFAEDAVRQVLEWTRRYPDIGFGVLARMASENERAAEALRRLAAHAPKDVAGRLESLGAGALVGTLGLPTSLTTDSVLTMLDEASMESWPIFVTGVDGRCEYFGLRVIGVAAREGDGWAIVFERLQGCDPDSFSVTRFAYGPHTVNGYAYENQDSLYEAFTFEGEDDDHEIFHGRVVHGPAGPLVLEESLFARHDLRPGLDTEFGGWPARTLALRAYLAEHPGIFWPPPEDALKAAGLPDGQLVVVSTEYQHPSIGFTEPPDAPWQVKPSESTVMRSLVDAILARDPSRWQPGVSNTDWRLHAREANEYRMPWTIHRVPTDGGYLQAAMVETGAALDARGLLPVEEARQIIASVTTLARGEGRRVGDRWVWDRDRVWAALLSLADLAEARAALARIAIVDPPRDASKNTALVERYGSAAADLTVAGQ